MPGFQRQLQRGENEMRVVGSERGRETKQTSENGKIITDLFFFL